MADSEQSDEDLNNNGDHETVLEVTGLLVYNQKKRTVSYKAIGLSDDTSNRKGNIFSSVFTLISTMIGGGLLSLPFAFQQGGFVVSSLVLFFTFLTSTYGAFLIVNSKKYCHTRVNNIEDVARVAFGRKGECSVQVLLICMLYLSSVAYMILITEQMFPIAELLFGFHSVFSRKLTLMTIIFLIVFPISLMKNLSMLSFTSSLSVICGMFLCFCVTYRSAKSEFGGRTDNETNPVMWFPTTFGGLITCVSICEVGYSCHFNVLPVFDELRSQTRRNKRIILITAMGLTYAMNVVVSAFGYLEFRKYTDQDITKNYPTNDHIVTLGRVAFCFVLLLSYPLLIVPCRASINKIIWAKKETYTETTVPQWISNKEKTGPNSFFWFTESLLLVGTSYALGYFVPQVNIVWGIVGAVGCTSLIYILPPAFYLRVRSHPEKIDTKKVFAVLLLCIGVMMLAAGWFQAVMNIVRPFQPMAMTAGRDDVTNRTDVSVVRKC